MELELFIERWSNPAGGDLFPWSIWRAGKQVHYGNRVETPEDAEREGVEYCTRTFGAPPDRVTRL